MRPKDNKELYSDTPEFDRWAFRTELDPDERCVLTRYLDPHGKTLEAGTAGGRVLLGLRELGFSNLQGYDYVVGFIEEARRRDTSGTIRFEVQDATGLDYADESFDQLLYVQQMLSGFEDEPSRHAAFREAFRILRPGGTAIFSFLCYEVRLKSTVFALFIRYLGLLRWICGVRRSRQMLPWMRIGNRFNPGALLDRGPYVHWFRVQEAADSLQGVGFAFRAIGTSRQMMAGETHTSPETLLTEPLDGALYCVCTKRSPSPELRSA